MNQQRQHTRKHFSSDVELHHDGNVTQGRSINISQGGIFVDTDLLPPLGSKLVLKMRIPGAGDDCEIPCIVRWVKEGEGLGLQFEQLRAIEMWALNKLIKSL